MPLDLELTRTWDHANAAGGEIALAVQAMKGEPDNKDRSCALDHLHKAQQSLATAITQVELQAKKIGQTLQIPR